MDGGLALNLAREYIPDASGAVSFQTPNLKVSKNALKAIDANTDKKISQQELANAFVKDSVKINSKTRIIEPREGTKRKNSEEISVFSRPKNHNKIKLNTLNNSFNYLYSDLQNIDIGNPRSIHKMEVSDNHPAGTIPATEPLFADPDNEDITEEPDTCLDAPVKNECKIINKIVQRTKSNIDYAMTNLYAISSSDIEYIKIGDISPELGINGEIKKFKEDIVNQLSKPEEELKIIRYKNELKIKVKESELEIPLRFGNKDDLKRFSRYYILSGTHNLKEFGNFKSKKTIRIVDYEDGLSKESQVQLFKDDVSRQLRTAIASINIRVFNDNIIAYKENSSKERLIEFDDHTDYERFLKYAKKTKSIRLQDFGERKEETIIRLGGKTTFPEPKENASFSQSIQYSTFIGDSAKHKVQVNLDTDLGLTGPLTKKNIKRLSIAYVNTDMPWTHTYGDIEVTYKEGKFGVDGKYEYLDLQVDKLASGLKEWDGKAIAWTAGGLVVAGLGVWAAAKYLPEKKDVDIPLKAKIYDNGVWEVRTGIKPTATIGEGELKFKMKDADIEVKQKIASGADIREKIEYNFEKEELKSEFEGNFDRANVKITNLYSFKNEEDTKTTIRFGKSHTIGKVTLSYSYYQEISNTFKLKNQGLSAGVEYNYSDDLRFNAGGSISIPLQKQDMRYSAD